jgi:hypothetical protein
MYKTFTMSEQVTVISQMLETQSLNALTSGFAFAAAMSWNDVARWAISQIVKGPKNTGLQMTITAITTTLLSIAVFLLVSSISKRVTKPAAPVYAVGR